MSGTSYSYHWILSFFSPYKGIRTTAALEKAIDEKAALCSPESVKYLFLLTRYKM